MCFGCVTHLFLSVMDPGLMLAHGYIQRCLLSFEQL